MVKMKKDESSNNKKVKWCLKENIHALDEPSAKLFKVINMIGKIKWMKII